MTNENKDKIIDRVIDFLYNKPLKSDMIIAASLIEELKLLKNCSIPAVVGRSEQLVCEHPDEAIIKDKPTDYCLACNRNI